MPADPLKIALYMQGTFYKPNANQQEMDAKLAAAKDIGGSGFGTVILGQWHVRPNGGIYSNANKNRAPIAASVPAASDLRAAPTQCLALPVGHDAPDAGSAPAPRQAFLPPSRCG